MVKNQKKRSDANSSHIAHKQDYAENDEVLQERKEKVLSNLKDGDRERVSAYLNLGSSKPIGGDIDEYNAQISSRDLTEHEERALQRRAKSRFARHVSSKVRRMDEARFEAAVDAAAASEIIDNAQNHTSEGFLEPEGEMESTVKVMQKELKRQHLDEHMARQIYNLKLEEYGPYKAEYSRSGRHKLLFGRSGHVAMMDCYQLALQSEIFLNETVRDACFLHNETMFAVAQKKHAYIYDDKGTEIHELRDCKDPFRLSFLSYHWLLASVGRLGNLRYIDTSTGAFVSMHRTKLGPCSVMRQNQSNAVIHLGHSNGTVTLWSPASSEYLVKMICHRGPVSSIAIDRAGHRMYTGGSDGVVKLWDLRMFKEVSRLHFKKAISSLDISQRGLLGVGFQNCVSIYKDVDVVSGIKPSVYMRHKGNGSPLERFRFRPFEDVGVLSHSNGISSIVVPGAGEAKFDSLDVIPFQDRKQRNEAQVRSLLDKLSPDMISLDPNIIGTLERDLEAARNEKRMLADEADRNKAKKPEKKRMRGRSKVGKKLARKRGNILDASSAKYRKHLEEIERDASDNNDDVGDSVPQALKRFLK